LADSFESQASSPESFLLIAAIFFESHLLAVRGLPAFPTAVLEALSQLLIALCASAAVPPHGPFASAFEYPLTREASGFDEQVAMSAFVRALASAFESHLSTPPPVFPAAFCLAALHLSCACEGLPMTSSEERGPLGLEMLEKATVWRMYHAAAEESGDASFEATAGDSEPVPLERAHIAAIADRQRGEQHAPHGMWEAGGPALRGLQQGVTAAQEVGEAGLVRGLRELAVRRPAVAHDDPAVAGAEDRGGLHVAAAGLDGVDRHGARDEDPEPPQAACHLPPRLNERMVTPP
jgi:hypothetical protein